MLSISTLLAACDPAIGCITPIVTGGIDPVTGKFTGIADFFNSILRLLFAVAGIWAFINLIIAGFQFMTAGGDSKNISKAWNRIWQSFLGLLIIVCSFLIAAIIGIVIFNDPTAILLPRLK
jgi:hypothetical protein